MKQTIHLKIVFCILVCLLFLFGASSAVNADTVYVDHNNNTGVEDGTVTNPYNTIQEGIDAANFGDKVEVAPGSYSEDIIINGKNIYLIGGDPSTTTIQGASDVIRVNGVFNSGSDKVEIAGFTITGGSSRGIYISSPTSKPIIYNNIIINNSIGIYPNATANVSIINNIITQNIGAGISVGSYNCPTRPTLTIADNIISENGSYGITHSYSCGTLTSFYNNYWANTSGNYNGSISIIGDISSDPLFVNASIGNYHLSASSPSIDAGRPIAADNDPDGTRNNQGAYGGPFAASFWPDPAGGPVVTDLQVTPPSVPVGGTITINATGRIN